ncbi:hypothetical protein [Allocoleopsis sp.]|uniref:hypothetical protein n=1 Tax=Allocoleopsis sp. TaxID=3088169 RepID=UPI002FD6BE95
MINQLIGFFSSQRQLLKGWELPVAGLLITTGLAISVATLKTTSSQHKAQAANTIAASSTAKTAQAQLQEQAVDSSVAPSPVTAEAPQPQEQAVDSSVAPSPVTAEMPQSQEQAIDAPALAAPKSSAVSKPYKAHKGVIHSPAISPRVTTAPQQQEQEQAIDSPSVSSTVTAAVPQLREQALDAQPVAKSSLKWNRKAQERPKQPIAQVPKQDSSLQDGTYLYGQSSQAGEIGKEYIVFQAHQGKVVGAMYMPSSEYACFYGTLNSKQMNLTVVNPYNQTAFSHTIAREQTTQVAAAGGQIDLENTYDSLTYPHSIGLEGYLPINQVGDNDKQILNTCVSNYQAKVSTQ